MNSDNEWLNDIHFVYHTHKKLDVSETVICPHCNSNHIVIYVEEYNWQDRAFGSKKGDVFICPDCGSRIKIDVKRINQSDKRNTSITTKKKNKGNTKKPFSWMKLIPLLVVFMLWRSFNSSKENNHTLQQSVGGNEVVQVEKDNDKFSNPEEFLETIQYRYNCDAESYQGHIYAIFNYKDEKLNDYNDCERFCESMGGHLAVIESQEENDFIFNYIRSEGLTLAFFGYSDEEYEGDWQWANGSDSTWTNWDTESGQPNNGSTNSNKRRENYAEFFKSSGTGTWNDAPFGSNTYHFICEWE